MKLIQGLITVCIVWGSFALGATQLFAQSSLSFVVNPQYPKPSESIVISLDSFFVNIQTSLVRWEHEGVILAEGIGRSQLTFQTTEDTNISVSVKTQDGATFSQLIPIVVSDVDVLWQANNSYVPPFYKGKALPTEESSVISVVAIPNRPERDSLLYRFQKNGVDVSGQGGLGKPSFSFSTSIFDEGNRVSALVQNITGTLSVAGSNVVNYVTPEVVFYERDTRLGTYLQKVVRNNHTVDKKTINIVATPFFLSTTDLEDESLVMEWSVNNRVTDVPGLKNQISVAIQEGQRGIVPLSFFVKNTNRIFEEGTIRLNLNFN